MDPFVGLIGGERDVGVASAEFGEGGTFPWFDLTTVLDELGCVEPGGEAGEGAAGVDLRELVVVTDEHDLAAGMLGVVEELGELAGTDHGGFVDDHHRAAVELEVVGVVEMAEEPVEGHRGDGGAMFEFCGGAGSQRAADHAIAGGFPRFACRAEHVGLAGPRGAFDDVDAGTGAGDLPRACAPARRRATDGCRSRLRTR